MKTRNLRFTIIMVTAAALLALPLIAMQFTGEVKWGVFDFLLAGLLLFATGIAIEAALRTVKKLEHRVAACAGILLVLALVWIELAVGLFGTPLAGS